MFSSLSAYLVPLRIFLVVVLLSLAAYTGFDYGKAKTEQLMSKQAQDFQKERDVWDAAREELNRKTEEALKEAQARVDVAEATTKQVIHSAEVNYANNLKRIQDEQNNIVNAVVNPKNPNVIGSGLDIADYGLWVFVDEGTCTKSRDSNSSDPLSQTYSTLWANNTQQCRLSARTAIPLIQIAADANKVAENLNLCIKEFNAQANQNTPAVPEVKNAE